MPQVRMPHLAGYEHLAPQWTDQTPPSLPALRAADEHL